MRYKLWYSLMEKSQVILVVEKATHEQYFREGKAGRLDFSPHEIDEQIQNWIKIINTFPNLLVGLQETQIATSYMLAGSSAAMIYGSVPPMQNMPFTGIRGLKITYPPTVLKFRLQFEQAWHAISLENKDRARVIEWLKGL
jgi:hypothetical protein